MRGALDASRPGIGGASPSYMAVTTFWSMCRSTRPVANSRRAKSADGRGPNGCPAREALRGHAREAPVGIQPHDAGREVGLRRRDGLAMGGEVSALAGKCGQVRRVRVGTRRKRAKRCRSGHSGGSYGVRSCSAARRQLAATHPGHTIHAATAEGDRDDGERGVDGLEPNDWSSRDVPHAGQPHVPTARSRNAR